MQQMIIPQPYKSQESEQSLEGDKRKGKAIRRSNNGFTLYELLVIIGILTLLTSLIIPYTRKSEEQLLLFRERAALVSLAQKARSLGTETWRRNPAEGPVCGFGVHFERTKAVLFEEKNSRELVSGSTNILRCSTPNFFDESTSVNEIIETYTFDPRIQLSIKTCQIATNICSTVQTANNAIDVLYIPPDPQVRFSEASGTWDEVQIIIEEVEPPSDKSIMIINKAGQATAEL